LVGGLFDFAVHIDNEAEQKRLDRLRTLFDGWRVENPGAHVERFIGFAQEGTRNRKLVNWYVVRRLTDDFVSIGGMRRTFYINSFRAREHAGVSRANSFFERMRALGRLGIVTTNYDMVPEYAFGSRGMNYGVVGEQIGWTRYPHIQPVLASGPVSIAKLHGSVSWGEEGTKTTDSRHGLTGRALIVPPVSEKQPPPLLAEQWTLARQILASCQKLVVFGFSFNENDLAVRNLVSQNLRRDALVVLVDAVDHRPRLDFLTRRWECRFVDVRGKPDIELLSEITQTAR
jgi:hypothetical protein